MAKIESNCKCKNVYPEYLDEMKHIESQSVYTENYCPQEKIASRESFKEAGVVLGGTALDFLKEAVFLKGVIYADAKNTAPLLATYCISKLLKTIPVYLVSSKMKKDGVKQATEENPLRKCNIPEDSIQSYNVSLETLKEYVEGKNLRDIDITSFDILGCYVEDDSSDTMDYLTGKECQKFQSLEKLQTSRRIFLWVDKIANAAEEKGCKYESLFFLILCHEMMHALMDVYGDKIDVCKTQIESIKMNPKPEEVKIFRKFREESHANGLAIYLFKQSKYYSNTEYLQIADFVNSQPLQYQLGILFQDKEVLASEVPEWLDIKKGATKLCKPIIYDWFHKVISDFETTKRVIQ